MLMLPRFLITCIMLGYSSVNRPRIHFMFGLFFPSHPPLEFPFVLLHFFFFSFNVVTPFFWPPLPRTLNTFGPLPSRFPLVQFYQLD